MARRIIEVDATLDIFAYAIDRSITSPSTLPSWVPDWTSYTCRSSPMLYHGNGSVNVAFVDDGRVLEVCGKHVGTFLSNEPSVFYVENEKTVTAGDEVWMFSGDKEAWVLRREGSTYVLVNQAHVHAYCGWSISTLYAGSWPEKRVRIS